MKKSYLIWSITIWCCILIVSLTWNYHLVKSSNEKIVLDKSRAFFEQILMAREWNAQHGGVYVPVNDKTLPNPYLEDSLRDLLTINGLSLTKINPAYMTRQIAETNKANNDLQFHITSLNPIRPQNKPDDWEIKSLISFKKGVPEHIELVNDGFTSQYRYMAPLFIEKSCLKCHSKQGYKPGDIRGGISVSFPAKAFTDSVNKQVASLGIIHFIILILGVLGLSNYYRMANKYLLIIENRNKELAKINATKDKFFSIIGHDLKAPFTGILGFSRILLDKIGKKDYGSIEKYAKTIHDSSERTYHFVGNLLDWASTQTGKIQPNPTNFDISTEMNNVKDLLNDTAQEKSITILNAIEDNMMVFADKEMIHTVIRNLISNAIKFTEPGGRIVISATNTKNNTTIKIADNGIGIPEEKVENLFSIYDKRSTKGTRKEKGTGLGLILCKEFIEKNNGEIWAESVVGKGSSFYFSLPVICAS